MKSNWTNNIWYCLYVEFKTGHKWTYLQNRKQTHGQREQTCDRQGGGKMGKGCTESLGLAYQIRSDQISRSVVSKTLCDPMNRSTPGLPVHHQLPEFTQIHVHRVSDAIQPSHPLSSPSPYAPNPSQHQSLFQWVNFSHEVAKVHHSFQRTPRADLL